MRKNFSIFIYNLRKLIIRQDSILYKIYKLYKNSIKLVSFINIFVLLYYTCFQLNFDYLAFMAIITSILDNLTYFIGKEFINQLKKTFYIFADSFTVASPQDNDSHISNNKVDSSQLDKFEVKKESVKDESYNKVKIICITIIGLSVCAYISWDLYTHGVIYTTICSIYNNITSSNSKDDGDDVSSNFDDSTSNASSEDSTTTLVAPTDALERGFIVDNTVNVSFWGTHVEIPVGSFARNSIIYR